jgi:hypothetical protein
MSKPKRLFTTIRIFNLTKKKKNIKNYSNTKYKRPLKANRYDTTAENIKRNTFLYGFLSIQITNLTFIFLLLKGLSSSTKKTIYHLFIDDYDSSEILENIKLQKQLLEVDNINLKAQVQLLRLSAEDGPNSLNHISDKSYSADSISSTQVVLCILGTVAVGAVLYVCICTNLDLNHFMGTTHDYFKTLNTTCAKQSTNILEQNQHNVRAVMDALTNQNTFFSNLSDHLTRLLNRASTMIHNQDRSHSPGGSSATSNVPLSRPVWNDSDE